MVRRYEITTEEWNRIKDYLPPERSRPRKDNRTMLNTKIHVITDALGNPLEMLLTAGNIQDSTVAIDLLSRRKLSESNVLADKAYGTKRMLDYIQTQDGDYTIPPKCNMRRKWFCDFHTYKERHVIECFFQKLKWFRRIATRYDQCDKVLPVGVFLASIFILLK